MAFLRTGRLARLLDLPEIATSGAKSFLLRLLGIAATFALGVMLARHLGPAEYGIYGLAITVVALLTSLGLLGTPQLAVRQISVFRMSDDRGGVRLIVRNFSRIVAIASLLLAAATLAAGFLLGARGRDLTLLCLSGTLLFFSALSAISAAHLRGLQHLWQGQFFDTAGKPFIALALLLAALVVGLPLNAAAGLSIQVGATLIGLLVSWAWLRSALPSRDHAATESRHLPWASAALPLCAVDFLSKLDGSYGLILLGPLSSDVELGIFRVALACVTLIGMPATVFHVILAPKIAELVARDDRQELSRTLRQVSLILLCCMVPGTAFLYLLGEPLIGWAFGAAYAPAASPVFILAIAQSIYAAFGMGPILLAMGGGETTLIRIYIVAATLGMIAAVPLIIQFGASGAAAAQLVSLSTIGLMSWRYAYRRWGVDLTCLNLVKPPSAEPQLTNDRAS